jgi:hypothetical protein
VGGEVICETHEKILMLEAACDDQSKLLLD